jgi:uncharacterized membrane protein YbhN (UPF0104 family)
MRKQRHVLASIVMPIVFGLVGFSNIARKERFAAFHTVDIVQLLASGMCFGVALTALMMLLLNPNAPKSAAEEQ